MFSDPRIKFLRIYTNKVAKQHTLLNDEVWLEEKLKVKKEQFEEVEQIVFNFVDDSNTLISFKEPTYPKMYL